jgi:hypothetical protein
VGRLNADRPSHFAGVPNIVAAIRELVQARIITSAERTGLVLTDNAGAITLRYALVMRDSDELFFPESLLDDWGHEINSLELYEWVQENGMLFPRAELFGFEGSGKPSQYFLREVDLVAPVHCFVFKDPDSPLAAGVQVDVVLTLDFHVTRPIPSKRPPGIKGPMGRARVSWWRVPADVVDDIELDQIDPSIDEETTAAGDNGRF